MSAPFTAEQAAEWPLTETLTKLGYRHERDEHSNSDGRHGIWRGSDFIGRMRCDEAWSLVRAELEGCIHG